MVPAFVDNTCGTMNGSDDAGRLADAFPALQTYPRRFVRLSQVAGAGVRRGSDADQTIARELDWLRR